MGLIPVAGEKGHLGRIGVDLSVRRDDGHGHIPGGLLIEHDSNRIGGTALFDNSVAIGLGNGDPGSASWKRGQDDRATVDGGYADVLSFNSTGIVGIV